MAAGGAARIWGGDRARPKDSEGDPDVGFDRLGSRESHFGLSPMRPGSDDKSFLERMFNSG